MIRIICVGKIKEKYFSDAIDEYTKRLSKYTKLELIEVNDESKKSEKEILKLEAEKIKKQLISKSLIITTQIEGRQISSTEFSNTIDKALIENSNIVFIIGGSYGLDESIKELADIKLSFSKMTFPHQMFRIILLEQIYRAFKIINNESYHK